VEQSGSNSGSKGMSKGISRGSIRKLSKESSLALNVLTIVCIFIEIGISSFYTKNESWRGLMMKLDMNDKSILSSPAPTASAFLTEDDLRLFSGFTKKTFISPPWKGLAISAATGNYPLATKPSTIGVFTLNYDWFVNTTCEDKQKVSIENNISYAYSAKFDCPNFIKEGESTEGLILYRFKK